MTEPTSVSDRVTVTSHVLRSVTTRPALPLLDPCALELLDPDALSESPLLMLRVVIVPAIGEATSL